mmetsp:Transcript_56861/g.123610  ORF Transcript_56861/g.123610 Transcript_56861/m.123610 type:complete len:228 (+) Transcript_56861:694-1377(+)
MKLTVRCSPWMTLRQPSGRPASFRSLAMFIPPWGTTWEGLRMTVFPVARATGTDQSGHIKGKLNGMMVAVTPIGVRNECVSVSAERLGMKPPMARAESVHACSTISMPRAISPAVSALVLPCSLTMSFMISSWLSRMSSIKRIRILVRVESGVCDQLSKARFDEATAASISSGVELGIWETSSMVAGLRCSIQSEVFDSTYFPSMMFGTLAPSGMLKKVRASTRRPL